MAYARVRLTFHIISKEANLTNCNKVDCLMSALSTYMTQTIGIL
jgi:hypothetical protein